MPHDDTQELVVRASFDRKTIHIVVEDEGRGFDPGSVPQERLERLIAGRRSGGLGMRLIKSLMGSATSSYPAGRTSCSC